ncbi:hypothetical protein LOD99_12726 [Oopsacas minuta]|uniref:UBA domain-containing protein n=1 Tax=Oopsacas minuta TaxID=111878 RepID=A0AAV7JCU7_9METZ|nr:hypothetical protein LOD99_12726 [Oopsacas minuta]
MLRLKYPDKDNIREFNTAEVSIPTISFSQLDVSLLRIGQVRQVVEEQMHVSLSSLELVYGGRKLNKVDKLLSDYGIRPNTVPTMHLLPITKPRASSDVMMSVDNKLESAKANEQLKKFIANFPTLHVALQDPAVLTQLKGFASKLSNQDFDLMLALLPADAPQIESAQFRERLLQPETLPEYLKTRPELAGFLNSLLVRDSSGKFRIDPKNLGGIPDLYNLDDQPEMDLDFQAPSLIVGPPTATAPVPPPPTQPLITEEMLSLALAQTAQASTARQTTGQVPGNMTENLRIMRDMGFTNETACLRALQTSNGDLEAAVNLIVTSDIF